MIVLCLGVGALFAAFWYLSLGKTDVAAAVVVAVICGVVVLGTLAAIAVEWFGHEIVEIGPSGLAINHTVWRFSWSDKFDVTLIKYLRIGAANYWVGSTYVMSNGRIQFEYRTKPQAFGVRLTDDEAFEIINRIRVQMSADASVT